MKSLEVMLLVMILLLTVVPFPQMCMHIREYKTYSKSVLDLDDLQLNSIVSLIPFPPYSSIYYVFHCRKFTLYKVILSSALQKRTLLKGTTLSFPFSSITDVTPLSRMSIRAFVFESTTATIPN